jgi:hypothetical protein
MTIVDKVKLVLIHRDSPDVETELGIFPSKEAAMPAFREAILKHDPFERQLSPLAPMRPQKIPLRINGLLDARAKGAPARFSSESNRQTSRCRGTVKAGGGSLI